MEEEKQSRVHLDLARRIFTTMADGEGYITQEVAIKVLKPLLEEFIAPGILKIHTMPEKWFKKKITVKDDLINDLSSYLQKIKFIEPDTFN